MLHSSRAEAQSSVTWSKGECQGLQWFFRSVPPVSCLKIPSSVFKLSKILDFDFPTEYENPNVM